MPRAQQVKNYNTFVKGLVTEASPLTFPENASLDEENFELYVDGSRRRRKGIEYEVGSSSTSVTLSSDDALVTYNWDTVAGDAAINFVVVQTGAILRFYTNGSSFGAPKAFTVDLTTRKVSGQADADVQATNVSMSHGKGQLFVTGRYIEPFRISYDSVGDSITLTRVYITARDFTGSEEVVAVNNRPAALTAAHEYDLANQGWASDTIASFKTSKGVYPSNADIWHLGKRTNPSSGIEEFNADYLQAQAFGNTNAPRGHFITATHIFDTTESTDQSKIFTIDDSPAWTWNPGTQVATVYTTAPHGLSAGNSFQITGNEHEYDDGASGPLQQGSLDGTYTVISSSTYWVTFTYPTPPGWGGWLDQYKTLGFVLAGFITNPNGKTYDERPEVVAFFAGRAWYMGVANEDLGSNVYYTQLIERDEQIGKCYQDADPTSEHINDLIDTDGGFISIPEMGQAVHAVVLGTTLVIFADNGVWSIETGEKGYFVATSHGVRRLSTVGVVAAASVIVAENVPFYWGEGGVYAIQEDKISGFLNAQNISEGTIQSLFIDVPDGNKTAVKGAYDPINREVVWLYSTNVAYRHRYTEMLKLNLRLEAWNKHSFTDKNVWIAGVAQTSIFDDKENKLKYFTNISGTAVTWSNLRNTSWLDWETFDGGADAAAYLITGYEILQDMMRNKAVTYLTAHFNRTEENFIDDGGGNAVLDFPSSCTLQAQWDWANSASSGKWGSSNEIYRLRRLYTPSGTLPEVFDNGYPVTTTKNVVRGTGKSLSLKFTTSPGKDCHLYGWAVLYTGSSSV